MSPLYLYNGKLLIDNNKLAANESCCCGCPESTCVTLTCSMLSPYSGVDCTRAKSDHIHTITIPEEYALPVEINISGGVDDDLLINGQSITIDLNYDTGGGPIGPGHPYLAENGECVGAHTIGSAPDQNDPTYPIPSQDPNAYPSILFSCNDRSFEVSVRDTVGGNVEMTINICLDPYNKQNVCLPPIVSGCCGTEVYCYEKTIYRPSPCVTYICAAEPPPDYTQIGGPYDCSICENCGGGSCVPYSIWKITDQDNYIYASGIIGYQNNYAFLMDVPYPFIPLFYNSLGGKDFSLQAYCNAGEWSTLDSWSDGISLCGTIDDRFPPRYFSQNWAPQGACAEPINNNGDFVCDEWGAPILTCPPLVVGTTGDGQAWRDPRPGVAYKFTGAIDNEWTNLNNWQDADGYSPAGSLPGDGNNIVIEGVIDSYPNDFTIPTLNTITVNSGGDLGISITCANLVGNDGEFGIYSFQSCPLIDGKVIINVTENCTITYGSISGRIILNHTGSSTMVFNGSEITGTVNGGTIIFNNSSLRGNITYETATLNNSSIAPYSLFGTTLSGANTTLNNGSINSGGRIISSTIVTFNTGSYNSGTVSGGSVIFNGSGSDATFNDGTINDSSVTFNGESSNTNNGTLNNCQPVIFNNYSTNNNTIPTNSGPITFNNYSKNKSIVHNATFNGNAENDTNGVVQVDSTFNVSSINKGTVGGNNCTTIFNGSSENNGTVQDGTTTFNLTSANNGTVNVSSGYAVNFNGDSDNNGIVSAAGGSIFFNSTSSNNATVTVDSATFNGSSENDTSGTVYGDATFNVSSRNKGFVNGTATFTGSACNDGGTAGTFVPDPPPSC
jgi:hypothetical protein